MMLRIGHDSAKGFAQFRFILQLQANNPRFGLMRQIRAFHLDRDRPAKRLGRRQRLIFRRGQAFRHHRHAISGQHLLRFAFRQRAILRGCNQLCRFLRGFGARHPLILAWASATPFFALMPMIERRKATIHGSE